MPFKKLMRKVRGTIIEKDKSRPAGQLIEGARRKGSLRLHLKDLISQGKVGEANNQLKAWNQIKTVKSKRKKVKPKLNVERLRPITPNELQRILINHFGFRIARKSAGKMILKNGKTVVTIATKYNELTQGKITTLLQQARIEKKEFIKIAQPK